MPPISGCDYRKCNPAACASENAYFAKVLALLATDASQDGELANFSITKVSARLPVSC
jgi:hypothetical protein